MIYKNDDDEYKKAAEILVHVVFGGFLVAVCGLIYFLISLIIY